MARSACGGERSDTGGGQVALRTYSRPGARASQAVPSPQPVLDLVGPDGILTWGNQPALLEGKAARNVAQELGLRFTGFPGVVGRAGVDRIATRSQIRQILKAVRNRAHTTATL